MHRKPYVRLKALRIERGFASQARFCAHAKTKGVKIVLRRYRDIEAGRAEKPSLEEIRDICFAMGISADLWLFGAKKTLDISGFNEKEAELISMLAKGLLHIRPADERRQ